jgi:predicted O-linked N-acetylglucosamine transferase (SPINDLY family)
MFKWLEKIKWLDTSLAEKFAVEIADQLTSTFPPKEITDPRRKSPARFKRVHSSILDKARQFSSENRMSIYQRAQLGTRFKGLLFDAGYAKGFVDTITLELMAVFSSTQLSHTNDTMDRPIARSYGTEYLRASELVKAGQLSEAKAILVDLVADNPVDFNVLHALGRIEQQIGNPVAAVDFLMRATKVNSRRFGPFWDLANIYLSEREYSKAEHCLSHVVALEPKMGEAHNLLGIVNQLLDKPHSALRNFREAVRIDEHPGAYSNLGMTLVKLGNLREGLADLRRAVKLAPDSMDAWSNYLFSLSHDPSASPEFLFLEHRRFSETFETPLKQSWQPHRNSKDRDCVLRIGFVSADLCAHPVAKFIGPIFEELNQSAYQIWVYTNHPHEDSVTQRLRAFSHHWDSLVGVGDDECAQRIRKDEIDILIDLSGHTAFNRLGVFARKPAPVQASWIGSPNTTGLSAMDYYLADPFSAPPGLLDDYFSEKIVRLPTGPVFSPELDSEPVSPLPALRNGYLTFASVARGDKIGPDVVELWCNVLKAVKGSRMILFGSAEESHANEKLNLFQKHGIERDRLTVLPGMDLSKYLAAHSAFDIILDTFPFSGGTTTCHAAWMGVPVLTLAGKTLSSRSGTIVNGNLGTKGFVAESKEEFVELARQWAEHVGDLSALRSSLRIRLLDCNMCKPKRVTRHFESALRTMWHQWCNDSKPVSFQVNDAP